MKIELNLPANKQRLFLDYLNAQLRERTSQYNASAGYREDGMFENTLSGLFSIDEDKMLITWNIVTSKDGILLYIEAENDDVASTKVNWENAVDTFIRSVLTATIAERKNRYFKRFYFNYIGSQLDGEYWISGCRFAPVWPEDDEPYLIYAERVVSIDINVDAIDEINATYLGEEIARRLASRLSLLLNVGLYQDLSHNEIWVIPSKDGTSDKAKRLLKGFFGFGSQLTKMPKKGEICPAGKFLGSLTAHYHTMGTLLSLPPEARKIFTAISSTTPNITEAFDRSSRLYQVSKVVGRQFPSVGFAYQVAAVEAISQCDPSSNSFSQFVRNHVQSIDENDKILDYLYRTVRSSHFHAGSFPLGEFDINRYFDPIMDNEKAINSQLQMRGYAITREAIVHWIFNLLNSISEKKTKL